MTSVINPRSELNYHFKARLFFCSIYLHWYVAHHSHRNLEVTPPNHLLPAPSLVFSVLQWVKQLVHQLIAVDTTGTQKLDSHVLARIQQWQLLQLQILYIYIKLKSRQQFFLLTNILFYFLSFWIPVALQSSNYPLQKPQLPTGSSGYWSKSHNVLDIV